MPDMIDAIVDQQQAILDMRIKNARKTSDRLQPTGRCYNCEEPLKDKQLFCDADCAEDFDKLKRR